MISELQEWMESIFLAGDDAALLRGVSEGVALGDSVMENEPFLRSPVGRDIRGHVRRTAILWRVQDLCLRGDLPWEADMPKMPIGTWHHLEIRPAPSVLAYMCKTDSPLAFPKDTPNRQHERLISQPDLWDVLEGNVIPLRSVMESSDTKCVWLTYGLDEVGEVTHLCWAMPSPASQNEAWLAHLNVMSRVRQRGEVEPARRTADPTILLRFRQEIGEALSQTNNRTEQKEE